MGISGAGKSTLLNMIAAVEWPDSGTILWSFPDNNEQIRWSSRGPSSRQVTRLRRNYFGYAFQDSTLIPNLRVCDNLAYPLLLKGYSNQDALRKSRDCLESILVREEEDIDNLFRRFPSKLSGGQRQRVALVQAMIHDPYVIFADEPTGSLDHSTRKLVMKVLYDWVDDPNYSGKRYLIWVHCSKNEPGNKGTLHVDSSSHVWRRR